MQAKDLMVQFVPTVRVEDTLARAAALLRDRDCAAAVVLQAGRPVAVVTDRDICMAALRTNKPLSELAVASAMSRALHAARPEEPLAELAARMASHGVGRLPVVDGRGSLVGLVARADLERAGREPRDRLPAAGSVAAAGS